MLLICKFSERGGSRAVQASVLSRLYPVLQLGHAGVREIAPLLRTLDRIPLAQPRQLLCPQAFLARLIEKTPKLAIVFIQCLLRILTSSGGLARV